MVGERVDRDRLTELGRNADDEPELELEVEAPARAEGRRVFVRRLALPARPDDVRAADDDASGPAVVRDGEPTPVRQERLLVRPEHAPEVRRVLERGVEVDVVRNLERESQAGVLRRDTRPVVRTRGGDRLPPRPRSRGEQLVQRRPCEDVADARQVDGLAAVPPEQSVRPGAETHRIPSSSSSATGSKNEHVPIEWKSDARTSASFAGGASRSRQRNEAESSTNAGGRSRNAS